MQILSFLFKHLITTNLVHQVELNCKENIIKDSCRFIIIKIHHSPHSLSFMLQSVPLPILITKYSKCKSSSTSKFAIIQIIIYTTKCINYKLLILWLYKYLLSLTCRVAFTWVGLRNGEWLSPLGTFLAILWVELPNMLEPIWISIFKYKTRD